MPGLLVTFAADGTETRERYEAPRPTLEQLQKAVAGYIEPVRVRYMGRVREGYANEEGLLEGLPVNPIATRMFREVHGPDVGIVGPLVIVLPDPKRKRDHAIRTRPMDKP